MWLEKLGEWFSKTVVVPLILDLIQRARDWFKRKKKIEQRTTENSGRVEDYEKAPSGDATSDEFGRLP